MKKCPFCDGEIQDVAIKCKHCKEWLPKESPESDKYLSTEQSIKAGWTGNTIKANNLQSQNHIKTPFASAKGAASWFIGIGIMLTVFNLGSPNKAAGIVMAGVFLALIVFVVVWVYKSLTIKNRNTH